MSRRDGGKVQMAPPTSRRAGGRGVATPRRSATTEDHGSADMDTAAPGLVKLSLNLSADLFDGVERAAAQRRVTKTEVMRRAISVHLFLEEVRAAEGGKLELFVRRQGMMQQVVFPWFL